jgi:hypothetical protein
MRNLKAFKPYLAGKKKKKKSVTAKQEQEQTCEMFLSP